MGTALLVALTVMMGAGCSCQSHELADAGDLDAPFRCGTPVSPQHVFGSCTPEIVETCQAWARTLTPTGVVYAGCHARSPSCRMGDSCRPEYGDCFCGSRTACSTGVEVCVSDPPGTDPRCVPICTQEEMP